jgi:hypothetical protein
MYEKANKNVKKAANQIVENLEDITKPRYTGGKYEKAKKNVKKAANQIADNMEEISKGGKSMPKDYLKDGVAVVNGGGAPEVGGNIKMPKYGVTGTQIGKFMEGQVKGVTSGSKKVKVDIE